MLLLLPSITIRIRIHVRRRGFSWARIGETALDDPERTVVMATSPTAFSDRGLMALNITGPRALGATGPRALGASGLRALGLTGPWALELTGPLVLGTNKRAAQYSAGGNAVTSVDCYRGLSVRSGHERKISARLKAGNSTFKTISEVPLDQSAARGAFLRAFAPVAPESSGRSANCSKSRRSSQLEKLRPSRAASVRAKASRSARNDTLVWVLPRARTPWRLFVLGVLTPHHPRKLTTPQYKNASK